MTTEFSAPHLRSRATLAGTAVLVGGLAGLGAVVFRELVVGVTRLLTGVPDYASGPFRGNPHLPGPGRWFVLLTPVVTGLLYGPLVHRFAREARGHGVPEVMLAVARNGGRIRPQVAAVKALASALTIGGGGSVGREGPIVQIGAALGSSLAQALRWNESRTRLLVACGAAGGIAATFNAPLAGVFFALEIVLRAWTAEAFGMVVVASVTASVIGRAAEGSHSFLQLPALTADHLAQYPAFALLGLLSGLAGVGFSRALYAVEDTCDRFWRGPEWLRPAVGGLLVGAVLLFLPQMYGVGYPVLEDAVGGGYGLVFLLVLTLGKVLATSLTLGIGGSGGVFAPSLFVGATTGAAAGLVAQHVLGGVAGTAGAYALVGMGAVLAGSTRAPVTAVVIIVELTDEYSLVLPLMLAVALATGVSHVVARDTVYTRKLLRRGIDLEEPAEHALARHEIGSVVVASPTAGPGTGLAAAAAALSATGASTLVVVDADARPLGVLTAAQLADALAAGDPATVEQVAEPAEPVPATTSLGQALRQLDRGRPVVVVDDGGRLLGVVGHGELLRLVSAQRASRSTSPGWTSPAA